MAECEQCGYDGPAMDDELSLLREELRSIENESRELEEHIDGLETGIRSAKAELDWMK